MDRQYFWELGRIIDVKISCPYLTVIVFRLLRRGNGRLGWREPRNVVQDLDVRRYARNNTL